MDDNYQAELNTSIKNRKYLDPRDLKNITKFIGKNGASDKLLDSILEYFKIYPQQISLISKSNNCYINFGYIIVILLVIYIIHLLQDYSFIFYQIEKNHYTL